MKDFKHIFQKITIGTKQAKNRIEVAPAAPYLCGHDGSLTPEYYEYIRALAASGAGIVSLGVTPVDPVGQVGGRVLNLGLEPFVSDFNEIAELIHSYDALASAEVVYVRYMLSPPDEVVNSTSTEEVEAMIESFVDGVERLCRAGFDMALIHGGHGNVPAMFFSRAHNHRNDRFGGSFKGRCQFAIELLEGIRRRCGTKIALEYRISAEEMAVGSTTLEENLEFSQVIEPYIDLLHVSRGLLEEEELVPYINAPAYLPKAMNLPFAKRFKEQLAVPVTVVGSFDLDIANEAIGSGDVDMVSMVRTIFADTFCVEKARLGMADQIRPCIRCNVCIDRTHNQFFSVRCSVNPLLGRESRFSGILRGKRPHDVEDKKIVIVGGGPAGLEAARALSRRGYASTIYEKERELGGMLKLAGAGSLKEELRSYLAWSIKNAEEDPRITIRKGIEATPDIVAQEAPDVVLLALGARPILSGIDASEGAPVVWIGDAETNPGCLGERVVIAGAGMTGMEFALALSRENKQVSLVSRCAYEHVGKGATQINVGCLKTLLEDASVEFLCECQAKRAEEGGLVVEESGGIERTIPCDSVVVSFGFEVDEEVLQSFERRFPSCYRIGESNGRGGSLFNVTQSAFDRAMNI